MPETNPSSSSLPPVEILNLTGDLVVLGPLRRDLIPDYLRWSNDLSTGRTLGLSWPATLEQETATFEARVADPGTAAFTVYERATQRPIGIVYLYQIEPRHARASFGITIGEANARGKGYGTEATRLVLGYAFNERGLENVLLTVYEFNRVGSGRTKRRGSSRSGVAAVAAGRVGASGI